MAALAFVFERGTQGIMHRITRPRRVACAIVPRVKQLRSGRFAYAERALARGKSDTSDALRYVPRYGAARRLPYPVYPLI